MPDDAERFSVSSSSSSSFPRFEDHSAMNLEAGVIREKRDAAAVEGDLGECRLMILFLVRGCEVGT